MKIDSLHRRHFLKGLGAACFLPHLNVMAAAEKEAAVKRICAIFFPFGIVSTNKPDLKDWNWFPHKTGSDYKMNKSMIPLEGMRDELSIFGGLSHPMCRNLAHSQGDTYLTGADIDGNAMNNHMSMDQVAAEQLGKSTRFDSLTLSVDDNAGSRNRTSTLAWTRSGDPIAPMNSPRLIFEYLFSAGSGKDKLKRLKSRKKIVDAVAEDFKRTQRLLGTEDKDRMDQYLTSINELEEKIIKTEKWIHTPPAKVDRTVDDYAELVNLDAEEYYDAMYDLMYLAIETDQTRVLTFMIGSEQESGRMNNYAQQVCGRNIHKCTHTGQFERMGVWDKFLSERLARFMKNLKGSENQHGNLLDDTAILYGCATSTLHLCKNYPTIVAGGKNFGFKHGSYQVIPETTPFSNLFVSFFEGAGLPTEQFHDSKGRLVELHKGGGVH